MGKNKDAIIVIAEDDPDDRFLSQEALKELGVTENVYYVNDGVEILDFLYRRNAYQDANNAPRPSLILLDLKMPKKTGWDVLQEIKQRPDFSAIPIVVLTTSINEEDRQRAYVLGARDYFTKPTSYRELVEVLRTILSSKFTSLELRPD